MEHFGHIPDLPKAQSQQRPTELDKSWVLSRIEMILSGYRKADYHDPEAFMAQVAINLMKFPQEIIEYVSAPETGIQTRSQWPPSLAEIVNACTAEQKQRREIVYYSNLPPAPPPRRVPRLAPPKLSAEQSYEMMVAKHGRPIGPFDQGREHPYGAK